MQSIKQRCPIVFGRCALKLCMAATLIAIIQGVGLISIACASDRFNSELRSSVVRIETLPDSKGNFEIGSGFLVSTSGDDSGKTLIITNKHMISDWNPADQNIGTFHASINVFFYRIGDPSGQSYRATKVDLLTSPGLLDKTRVHPHPSAAIDLVAIDVTDKVNDKEQHIRFSAYARSYFVRFDKIKDFYTDIGDQVIALGYPLGIRSLRDDYPLAKIGYLASAPGEEVSIPFPAVNRAGQRSISNTEGKFLLVDGLIVPGNSGGPVVLVGGVFTRRDPKTNQLEFTDKPIPNYVVGIVSTGLGQSGLTIVLSSDYLLDLLDSFS